MGPEQFQNFLCPYCGQANEILVDITGGTNQGMVVDCEVCCAPIVLRIKTRDGEIVTMDIRKENE